MMNAAKRQDYDAIGQIASSSVPPPDGDVAAAARPAMPTDGGQQQHLAPLSISSEAEIISIDAAIDNLGTGRFQIRVLIAAGLCFAADSMEIMLLSFLSIILQDEWGLTAAQTATITSCVFAGSLTGTLILGPLGDRVGRRPIFLACGLIISVFGIATGFATNYVQLVLTRFLVGFGVGGLTVPFDILAEFLPTRIRGRYLLLIEYFWTAGSMAVPLVAYLTVGNGLSWNIFVLICAIPCIASFVLGMYLVPESPRWLLSQGRRDEAMQILRDAAAVNKLDPTSVYPIGTELEHEEEETGKFSDLLSPKWKRITLLLWGAWTGFAYCYYGTIIAVTRVFEVDDEAAMDDDIGNGAADDDMKNAGVQFDYQAIFISSSAELIGTALVVFLIDRAGRIASQVSAYLIGGVCLFLLCFFSESGSRTFLICVSFGARVCEMMGSCVTWVTTAEVLSTEIRTTGHSAANAVARTGGFFSPYLVGGKLSLPTVGIIMLVVHVFTAFCASRLPETRGKRLGHALSMAVDDSGGYQFETEMSSAEHKARVSVTLNDNIPAGTLT
jgi:MFS family permease